MKKVLSLLLVVALMFSITSVPVFANDGIPDDLPEGTVKIAEGIYMYTPDVAPCNAIDWTDIGDVPRLGLISMPTSITNVIVDSNDRYINIECSEDIRINFSRGNTSIFGDDYYNWPSTVEGSIVYIDAEYYGFDYDVPYRLQCTSRNAEKYDVQIRIWSSENPRGQFELN